MKPRALRGIEQGSDVVRLVAPGRLDLPGDGEVRAGAHSGMDSVAVEAADLAHRDRRAVSPRGVRVGEALPLAPPFDRYRWSFA